MGGHRSPLASAGWSTFARRQSLLGECLDSAGAPMRGERMFERFAAERRSEIDATVTRMKADAAAADDCAMAAPVTAPAASLRLKKHHR